MRHTALVTVVVAAALLGSAGSVAAQSSSAGPSTAPSEAPGTVASPAASASTASGANPLCDPFITAQRISDVLGVAVENGTANDFGGTYHDIWCDWRATGVGTVSLRVFDDAYGLKHKPINIEKWSYGEPMKGLGVKAYSGTDDQGNFVAWAPGSASVDRAVAVWADAPADTVLALAQAVDSAAEPGSEAPAGPSASAPVTAGTLPTELVGTWTLQTLSGKTIAQMLQETGAKTTDLALTLTLGADGSSLMALDCKPSKGKQPFAWKATWTADATTVDIASSTSTGSCKDRSLNDFLNLLSFSLGLATHPATWTVDGDTLTISGNAGQSLVLTRSAG